MMAKAFRIQFAALLSPNRDAIPLLFLHGWPGSHLEKFLVSWINAASDTNQKSSLSRSLFPGYQATLSAQVHHYPVTPR